MPIAYEWQPRKLPETTTCLNWAAGVHMQQTVKSDSELEDMSEEESMAFYGYFAFNVRKYWH